MIIVSGQQNIAVAKNIIHKVAYEYMRKDP
ncbi:MAG: hypothetical protein BWX51_01011 [Bacteroidetes bacterium ADurb.Bin012]|jgi:hypothetical protein|nr:MAG: hypothetical protein BWX51_01011 [Bacteroidetes bacterium ADurb.Bin012]